MPDEMKGLPRHISAEACPPYREWQMQWLNDCTFCRLPSRSRRPGPLSCSRRHKQRRQPLAARKLRQQRKSAPPLTCSSALTTSPAPSSRRSPGWRCACCCQPPLCPDRCAPLSKAYFSLKLTSGCSTSCAQQLSASVQKCLTYSLCPHKACIAWCVTSVQAEPEVLHVHSTLSWHRAGSADILSMLV